MHVVFATFSNIRPHLCSRAQAVFIDRHDGFTIFSTTARLPRTQPLRRKYTAFEHFVSYLFCSYFLNMMRKRVTLDKFATRREFRRAVRQDETLAPADRIRIHGMRRLKAHVAKTPFFTAKVRVLRCNPAPQLPPSKAYFLSPGTVFCNICRIPCRCRCAIWPASAVF